MAHNMQAGFLKSSAKITLYPKPTERAPDLARHGHSTYKNAHTPSTVRSFSPTSRSSSSYSTAPTGTALTKSSGTWICPICSFSNPVPPTFDRTTATSATPLQPCLACGIKPPFTLILKSAINTISNSTLHAVAATPNSPRLVSNGDHVDSLDPFRPTIPDESTVTCPRCTFLNHPSLLACEICGAPLLSSATLRSGNIDSVSSRPDSPGPLLSGLTLNSEDVVESVKFSFRAGGEKVFYERLKGAMVQREWLQRGAPPVPEAPGSSSAQGILNPEPLSETHVESASTFSRVGIAGLERRGMEARKKNEVVIGNAFEDLEALMASAKEIVALAESFAAASSRGTSGVAPEASSVISQSAAALGMVTTRDLLGSGGGSDSLYVSELSRNLAELLTDDRKAVLRNEGGIISLIDLWALFNRSRNGVELVSPTDFQRAAQLWEKLRLPVRLRCFKSGLLAVQRYDWSDAKTIAQFKTWFQEMRMIAPSPEVPWDWRLFGRGVTAQEAAQRFGWSVGVATEELEMAEDHGILCREERIEGLRFWSNHIMDEMSIDGGPEHDI